MRCITFCLLLFGLFLDRNVNAGVECDFEPHCNWTFTSSPPSDDPSATFQVVTGRRDGKTDSLYSSAEYYRHGHNPANYAMFNSSGVKSGPHTAAIIQSPYYQLVSSKCSLSFKYRIYGANSPQIVVATSTRQPGNVSGHDAPLVMIGSLPAINSYNDRWREATFDIGNKHRGPFRIHIECLPGVSDDQLYDYNDSEYNSNMLPMPNRPEIKHTECFIDQIALNDCNELEEGVCPLSEHRPRYMCEASAQQSTHCVYADHICDMHNDCPLGEDESEPLHNCSQVPLGARCTFEPNMCGWSTQIERLSYGLPSTANASDALRWRRISPRQAEPDQMMPGDRMFRLSDHTYKNASGHFMHLVIPRDIEQHFTSSQLLSPWFPPLAHDLADPTSAKYASCAVRFYFCYRSEVSKTAKMFVLTRSGRTLDELWTAPSKEHAVVKETTCAWQRASVTLSNTSNEEYRIVFQMRSMGYEELAIDDLSVSPACFVADHIGRRPQYNLTSCGAKGASGPALSDCTNAYNGSGVRVTIDDASAGAQSWMVPASGEYRITAYGASGGGMNFSSSTATPFNAGAAVGIVVNLTQGAYVRAAVGQQGQTPCDTAHATLSAGTPFKSYGAVYQVCDSHNYSMPADAYPGTGGGGASVVEYNGQVLVVAAGGGGYFGLPSRNTESGDASQPHLLLDSNHRPNLTAGDLNFGDGQWLARGVHGRGLHGRTCPNGSQWQYSGGFGGGGAACTAGGGGGGGWIGGRAGQLTNGEAGKSYINRTLAKAVATLAGARPANRANGLVVIEACTMTCHEQHAICRFIEGRARCVCRSNGRLADNLNNCKLRLSPIVPSPMAPAPPVVAPSDFFLFMLIIVCVMFLLVCIIATYLVYHYGRRKAHDYKYSMATGQQQGAIPMAQFRGGHGGGGQAGGQPSQPNAMQFNPDYESFMQQFQAATFTDMRQIPRGCVTLIKALGQGAFGEVYQGVLTNYAREHSPLPIAVKTLPEFVTETAQLDFTMEALIMSKFNHENIVRFIGVCFEKMPRFIVLELLAGGDLKTFLRNNRPKRLVQPTLAMVDLLSMSLDVARGCQYLEDNHFIHRDIAARNCLLTTKDADRVVKIADFGMARDIYREEYYKKGGKAMLPVKWMPPEAFLDGIFTSKTDVWSYGVLLWEMFSLSYMPYTGRSNQEVMQLVTAGGRLEAPVGCPLQIYQLMTSCWATVADERPRFADIVNRILACLADPQLVEQPLPPLVHEQTRSSKRSTADTDSASASCSTSTLTSAPGTRDSLVESTTSGSQDVLSSDSTMCASCHSQLQADLHNGLFTGVAGGAQQCQLPTNGTGVTHAAAAPYQPQSSEPYLSVSSARHSQRSSQSSSTTTTANVDSSLIRTEPDDDVFLVQQQQATGNTTQILPSQFV